MDLKEYLSAKEAMTYLGIASYNTFKRNYLKQGLPIIEIGNSKRIAKADIDEFLNQHKVTAKGTK